MYANDVDPDDKERLRAAHRAWIEAKRAADETFYGIVGDWYHGPKRKGDNLEAAEALGVSPSQLQRWARGESSGNRPRKNP
jgi:transcriptional regulator with XRE-family HTH domain